MSTTVPLSETDYETTNFSLWRIIGRESLIKSNIINWIACKEGTGSLAQMKKGSIICKLVRKVSCNQCSNVVHITQRGMPIGHAFWLATTIVTLRVQIMIGLAMIHMEKAKKIS